VELLNTNIRQTPRECVKSQNCSILQNLPQLREKNPAVFINVSDVCITSLSSTVAALRGSTRISEYQHRHAQSSLMGPRLTLKHAAFKLVTRFTYSAQQ
jgi:hypothetical protein